LHPYLLVLCDQWVTNLMEKLGLSQTRCLCFAIDHVSRDVTMNDKMHYFFVSVAGTTSLTQVPAAVSYQQIWDALIKCWNCVTDCIVHAVYLQCIDHSTHSPAGWITSSWAERSAILFEAAVSVVWESMCYAKKWIFVYFMTHFSGHI